MKKKVLVIVAHPDDEILWMGGNLLRNKKNWNTTIISLTRRSDHDRYPKFKRVIKTLGVKGFIYDLDDENHQFHLKPQEIIKTITPHIKNKKYDMLFTHNKNGEYNHPRHIDVHNAITFALKNNLIKTKKAFFFSYKKINNKYQGYAKVNPSADIFIKLNRDELLMKRKLAIDVYGYDRGGIGFEENSAGPIEAFNIYKKRK